jgi:hypothetical protein
LERSVKLHPSVIACEQRQPFVAPYILFLIPRDVLWWWGNLAGGGGQMSKGTRIWRRGRLSAVLDWWKSTVSRYGRFAGGSADQSRTISQQDTFENASSAHELKMVKIGPDSLEAEFREFTEAMRVGDRIRTFCDDGVIEAEKVSQTQFKLVYLVETTGSIH